MKCPKCGSELDTGFNCTNCDYKRYEVAVSKTELTTAEKLLWLFRNTNFRIINGQELGFYIDEIWHGFEFFFQSKNKAIKQAYDWVTKQEAKLEGNK